MAGDLELPHELAPERALARLPRFERRQLVAIFAGGLFGALLRSALEQGFPAGADEWPWATFSVNMLGAALLGTFVALLHERERGPRHLHPFLTVGVCGALSTFSTMMLELLRMLEGDHWGLALGYASASVIGGLVVVYVSTRLVRQGRWRA